MFIEPVLFNQFQLDVLFSEQEVAQDLSQASQARYYNTSETPSRPQTPSASTQSSASPFAPSDEGDFPTAASNQSKVQGEIQE